MDNGERRPIHIDDVPWEDFTASEPDRDRADGAVPRRPHVGQSGHAPSARGPSAARPPHWHLSDTLYIVTKGEFIVEGEGSYRARATCVGCRRFRLRPRAVRARRVEYLFISLGPYDKLDPDEFPPPLGRWDDPSTWVDGYPQVFRRTLLAEDPRRNPTPQEAQ